MAWPIKKIYGANVDPANIGVKQVAQNPAAKAASPPLQPWKHARNGKPPTTPLINDLNEAGNQAVLYRSKEIFSASGIVGISGSDLPSSAGAGDRLRWRWMFRTGPYSRGLLVSVIQHPQDSGMSDNSYARIDITTTSGSAAGTATFNHGPNPGGTTIVHGLAYLKESRQYIEALAPDTEYYGYAYDVDNGRMVSCCVADISSLTENFDGYLPTNIATESSILSVYRENLATISNALWKHGGGQIFNFSIEEPGAIRIIASATPTNIVDGSSTTYGAAIPGYDIDLTGCARLSQTSGVPIKFAAYIDVPAANTGVVTLRDSAGTAVVTLSQAGAFTGWVSGTGFMSSGKHYITHHRSAGAGTITSYATSCWQYET